MNAIHEFDAHRYPITMGHVGSIGRESGTLVYIPDLQLKICRTVKDSGAQRFIIFEAEIKPAKNVQPSLQADQALSLAIERGHKYTAEELSMIQNDAHEKSIEKIRVPKKEAQEILTLVKKSLDVPRGKVHEGKNRISQIIQNAHLFD